MSNPLTNTNTQIKILQRPAQSSPSNTTKSSVSHDVKTSESSKKKKRVTKTYEEREAEYAQARLRILGAAYPDSDDEEEKATDKDSDTNSKPPTPPADSQCTADSEIALVNGIIKKPSSPEIPLNSSMEASGIAVKSDS